MSIKIYCIIITKGNAIIGTDRPFSSPDFQGRSINGPYGDCVEELDGSLGKVLNLLDIDRKTLVIWASDNGAVGWNPGQGSNKPLRGWGYDTSEGGQRVPCIARWPGRIPPGIVRDDLTTMMDILPTVAHLAGTHPPDDRVIDGHNILPILTNDPEAVSPYDEKFFFLPGTASGSPRGPLEALPAPGKETL